VILGTPETPIEGVELIPIGEVEPSIIEGMRPGLEARFNASTEVGEGLRLEPQWFDPDREQYHAGPILDLLTERREEVVRPITLKTLGIVDQDLFAPGLSFIFGQAIVGGCCGMIGLARLRPEFYNKSPDQRVFKRRVLIEAVHEIGHTAGLDHCPKLDCAMNFSRTIEDSDRKGPDLCPNCNKLVSLP